MLQFDLISGSEGRIDRVLPKHVANRTVVVRIQEVQLSIAQISSEQIMRHSPPSFLDGNPIAPLTISRPLPWSCRPGRKLARILVLYLWCWVGKYVIRFR